MKKVNLWFTFLLGSCWTGTPEVYMSPIIHVRTVRPPAPARDDCQVMLDELWHKIDQPTAWSDCESTDPDYWYCEWCFLVDRAGELEAEAYNVVMACARPAD